ncbi:hypothetical protein D9619_012934 [Psilocybe cf. subviscida]|uniref:Uncharacterized protein n=1 Tax=Psilocybe cf. subviscida TaxID=2480587 RepID=A0A8H5BJM8_9AGAR|nr:hypothetical protein D9619_012934 [Psilocybe cf. subviscida]
MTVQQVRLSHRPHAALKEEERVIAEKHGFTATTFQKWENGVGGQTLVVEEKL